MNFLDKTGLAHFWSKIKSYIENKRYISSKDGSISNIVSITYEEYKNLEDSGKLDPDTEYHIIDAQSTIGDMEEFVSKLILESDKRKYPVGSLEFNVSGANPSSYLGFGTWELWGAGKVPVGVDTTQTEFNTVEKTGGSKTYTHTYSHTHGVPGVAHTHTSAAHIHTINGHTHTTGDHTLTIAEIPSHGHNTTYTTGAGTGYESYKTGTSTTRGSNNYLIANTGGGGAHNHGNTGSTSLTTNSTTPGATGSTTPSATTTNSQSTTNTSSTSNVQPYITCYMWKRTS